MAEAFRELFARRKSSSHSHETPDASLTQRLHAGSVEAGMVLELLPWPAAIWSEAADSCLFNEPAREIFGLAEESAPRQAWCWLARIHPDDRAAFRTAREKLKGGERLLSLDYRVCAKSAGETWVREVALAFPLRGNGRGVLSFYSPAAAERAEPLQDRPWRSESDRACLLRRFTHELRNSLQSVSGEVELLRLAGEVPALSFKSIAHGLGRIERVLNELDRQMLAREAAVADPGELLEEAAKELEADLKRHGIRIASIRRDALPALAVDWRLRSALRRVLAFSRALLPEGGELSLETGWRTIGKSRHIELRVACEARGSADEPVELRPFLEVDGVRTGLSLAVAREILRRHSGKIFFRRESPKRSVFSILLKAPAPF